MAVFKLWRRNIDEIAKRLAGRGFHLDVDAFNSLENARKKLQTETQTLQNLRNNYAKKIGQSKNRGEDISNLLTETKHLTENLKNNENQLTKILAELTLFLADIPNIPDESAPVGKDESFNQEIRRWGEPEKFDFTAKDHIELGEKLGLLDFESAAKMTSARFVIMQGSLVKLQRALIQFMIDVHTQEYRCREIYTPYIVNGDSLFGTGQLPKLENDLFKLLLSEQQNFYLIPTAEVPVTNMARDKVYQESELPLKWVCHTPCFRSEAGSYGKDTRGIIRQHQFEKVELVYFTQPEASDKAHEDLTAQAEKILQKLHLPYRVMLLCTGDMGFSAAKTYDLEVWLPGQQKYREISSCSNMQDFQARRLQARFKNTKTGKNEFIHTLNGSGLAVGRTLAAVMENYQDASGKIHIPAVLQSYMNGLKVIGES